MTNNKNHNSNDSKKSSKHSEKKKNSDKKYSDKEKKEKINKKDEKDKKDKKDKKDEKAGKPNALKSSSHGTLNSNSSTGTLRSNSGCVGTDNEHQKIKDKKHKKTVSCDKEFHSMITPVTKMKSFPIKKVISPEGPEKGSGSSSSTITQNKAKKSQSSNNLKLSHTDADLSSFLNSLSSKPLSCSPQASSPTPNTANSPLAVTQSERILIKDNAISPRTPPVSVPQSEKYISTQSSESSITPGDLNSKSRREPSSVASTNSGSKKHARGLSSSSFLFRSKSDKFSGKLKKDLKQIQQQQQQQQQQYNNENEHIIVQANMYGRGHYKQDDEPRGFPLQEEITLESLRMQLKTLFQIDSENAVTVDWVDDSNLKIIASDKHLYSAIAKTKEQQSNVLLLQVRTNSAYQAECELDGVESRRQGAIRRIKYHHVNNHCFVLTHFSIPRNCRHCDELIWGFGKQGYRCITCDVASHKKCHSLLQCLCLLQNVNSNEESMNNNIFDDVVSDNASNYNDNSGNNSRKSSITTNSRKSSTSSSRKSSITFNNNNNNNNNTDVDCNINHNEKVNAYLDSNNNNNNNNNNNKQRRGAHNFDKKYNRPTFCAHCGVLIGLHGTEGIQCTLCGVKVHTGCSSILTSPCFVEVALKRSKDIEKMEKRKNKKKVSARNSSTEEKSSVKDKKLSSSSKKNDNGEKLEKSKFYVHSDSAAPRAGEDQFFTARQRKLNRDSRKRHSVIESSSKGKKKSQTDGDTPMSIRKSKSMSLNIDKATSRMIANSIEDEANKLIKENGEINKKSAEIYALELRSDGTKKARKKKSKKIINLRATQQKEKDKRHTKHQSLGNDDYSNSVRSAGQLVFNHKDSRAASLKIQSLPPLIPTIQIANIKSPCSESGARSDQERGDVDNNEKRPSNYEYSGSECSSQSNEIELTDEDYFGIQGGGRLTMTSSAPENVLFGDAQNRAPVPSSSSMSAAELNKTSENSKLLKPTEAKGRGSVTSQRSNVSSSSSTHSGIRMTMDDFDILRVIGRGSYSKVVLAEYRKTKKLTAIKIVNKRTLMQDLDTFWVMTERYVLTSVNSPFLVKMFMSFQTEDRLFFVLEYVPGGDMMFYFQRKQRLSQSNATFYIAEIICALCDLHKAGVVYRDLKMDNILVDENGHIKLTDFGLCKEGMLGGVTTSTFCGTSKYMAPEIIEGADYTNAVDWWSLGVLIYEMLVGRPPFRANTEDDLFDKILNANVVYPGFLTAEAKSLIGGLLERDVSKRLGNQGSGVTGLNSYELTSISNLNSEEEKSSRQKVGGVFDIINHDFFRSIDWGMVSNLKLKPPYRPTLAGKSDTTHFDPEFTSESIALTPPDNGDQLTMKDNYQPIYFPHFSYEETEYLNDSLANLESVDTFPYKDNKIKPALSPI